MSYPAGCLELTDNEVTEYYQPKDFRVGNTIFVYGRRFLLLDCDPFTRKYYADVLKSPQNNRLKIEFPKKPLPKRVTISTKFINLDCKDIQIFPTAYSRLSWVRYTWGLESLLFELTPKNAEKGRHSIFGQCKQIFKIWLCSRYCTPRRQSTTFHIEIFACRWDPFFEWTSDQKFRHSRWQIFVKPIGCKARMWLKCTGILCRKGLLHWYIDYT